MADSPTMIDVYMIWVAVSFANTGFYEIYIDEHFFTSIQGGVNSATILLSFPATHHIEVKAVDTTTGLRSVAASAILTIDAKGNGAKIVGFNASGVTPACSWQITSTPFYATIQTILTNLGIIDAALSQYFIQQQTNMGASPSSSNYANGNYQRFSVAQGSPPTFTDNYPIGAQVHIEARGADSSGNLLLDIPVQVQDFVAGAPQWPGPLTGEIPIATLIESVEALAMGQSGGGLPTQNEITIFINGGASIDYNTDTVVQMPNGFQFTIPFTNIQSGTWTLSSGTVFDYFYSQQYNSVYYFVIDPTGAVIQQINNVPFTPHQ